MTYERTFATPHSALGGWTTDETSLPLSAGRDVVERIQGSWIEVADGAGHMVWYECPGSVRRSLERLAAGADAES